VTDGADSQTPDLNRFYFRQLLAGSDFATGNELAVGMANFAYLIGDRGTGECMVVDPAYGVAELNAIAQADGMHLTGALVTHYHADHCGGEIMGMKIEGAAKLLELTQIPVHIQEAEREWILKASELSADDLVLHQPGDTVMVGELPIQLVHTPGHTPGSQCFYVNGCLISGDTLFLEGCGRTDLPGGDPEELYYSLTQRLSQVPADAYLFPGHNYSDRPMELMGENREHNFVFRPKSAEQWMMMFGGA
jgi:glyoxylase-like metal-dependent hydrolase (beta-lactamase superfamily II)